MSVSDHDDSPGRMSLAQAMEFYRAQRHAEAQAAAGGGQVRMLRPRTDATTTAWAASALAGEAASVLTAPEGTRNHQLNRSAWKLANLVASGQLDGDVVLETLRANALAGGLSAKEVDTVLRGTDTGALVVGQDLPRAPADDLPPIPEATSWTPATAPAAEQTPPPPLSAEEKEQLARESMLAQELRTQWVRREAKTMLDDAEHLRSFRTPADTLDLAAELALPDDAVRYAVDALIPASANVLLAAQFKAGKTTLVGNLARAFADGEPFLGRFQVNAPDSGRIALWNYEVSAGQFRRWMRDQQVGHPERVSVLNLRGFTMALTVPRIADWAVAWLQERDCRWWVIDPWARAYGGASENDNAEVSRWLDAVDAIKERAGVEVLVMPTHTGRETHEAGAERARGATRLDDWADVRWLLTRDDSGNRFMRATGRDVEVAEEALTYDEATRRLTFGGHDRVGTRRRELEDVVVRVVLLQPGINKRELAKAVRATGTEARTTAIQAAVESAKRYHRVMVKDGPNREQQHYAVGEGQPLPAPLAQWDAPQLEDDDDAEEES